MTGIQRGREEFGQRLRALREDAHLTGMALARQVGWPGSKVSKIEHGKQLPTAADVAVWVGATGGSVELRADLLADLRTVRLEHRTWARLLRRGTAERTRAVRPLDEATTLLRAFEPALVPGLLQTAEYARWVLEGVISLRGLPNDVAEGVRARLDRQQVLYEPGKQFRFLMTEAALRYLLCPPEVLRGQLDRLLVVAGLPNVEVAVLPFSAQLPYPALHGFWMYDEQLVLVDTNTAELSLRDQDDIALYMRLFELMWSTAKIGLAAREVILSSTTSYAEPLRGQPRTV